MKKTIIFSLICLLVFGFSLSCRKKVEEVPPPPPPQVKEQPKVEKVVKPPVVKEPVLTEEEIFMRKTLEEINKVAPLEMIHFDFDKYFIRDDAKPVLEQNAQWLKKFKTAKTQGIYFFRPWHIPCSEREKKHAKHTQKRKGYTIH